MHRYETMGRTIDKPPWDDGTLGSGNWVSVPTLLTGTKATAQCWASLDTQHGVLTGRTNPLVVKVARIGRQAGARPPSRLHGRSQVPGHLLVHSQRPGLPTHLLN